MNDCAILVKDLKVRYRNASSYSIKKNLFQGKRLEKDYFEAVSGVSFSVHTGEIVGVIGKNGCGKSTLLRAIAGIFSADEGIVETFDNRVALMAIGVGFQPNLSGRENIILSGRLMGFTDDDIHSHIDSIIEFSELEEFIDLPVRTYSSGMYSKLAFSITAFLEPDIMLLDEVLSVGDQQFRKKSLARMKEMISNENRTVVIVSHNITTLLELCDRVIWMDNGKIVKIGDPRGVLKQYRDYMEK